MASPAWQRKEGQNKKGGLNEKGRKSYERENPGSNLKAPVKGAPKSAEEMKRKGSFLVRMGSSDGPLVNDKGEKTRLKLSLEAWGHRGDKDSAVAKGRNYLERAKKMKESDKGKK
jgi:hypothetical protein